MLIILSLCSRSSEFSVVWKQTQQTSYGAGTILTGILAYPNLFSVVTEYLRPDNLRKIKVFTTTFWRLGNPRSDIWLVSHKEPSCCIKTWQGHHMPGRASVLGWVSPSSYKATSAIMNSSTLMISCNPNELLKVPPLNTLNVDEFEG